MFETPQVMRMAFALAQHSGARQAILARNMSHADTPGYKAQDVTPFAETLRAGGALRLTRAGHMGRSDGPAAPQILTRDGPVDPNSNSVALDREMVAAAEVRHSHELALSVYQSSLDILRTSLGRAR